MVRLRARVLSGGVRQRVVHVDHLLHVKETEKDTSGNLMEDTEPAEDPVRWDGRR